jgi:hypothetical protein
MLFAAAVMRGLRLRASCSGPTVSVSLESFTQSPALGSPFPLGDRAASESSAMPTRMLALTPRRRRTRA